MTPDMDSDLSRKSSQIDFALLFDVVHEVPSADMAFAETFTALKSGGRLLFVEPKGHVGEAAFLESLESAKRAGLTVIEWPKIRRSRAALLRRQ